MDAGSAAGGVDGVEVARQRAGVRMGCADRRSGAADGEQHDRLARGARRLGERAPVAEVLAVDADHACAVVGGQVRDDLRDVEVGLVPDGHEPREAETEVAEQEPGLERDVAALRAIHGYVLYILVRRLAHVGAPPSSVSAPSI